MGLVAEARSPVREDTVVVGGVVAVVDVVVVVDAVVVVESPSEEAVARIAPPRLRQRLTRIRLQYLPAAGVEPEGVAFVWLVVASSSSSGVK